MASKSMFSNLIKIANGSDMVGIENDGERTLITNSHWLIVVPTSWYEQEIAVSIKGFPVVKKGECYRRDGKKNTAVPTKNFAFYDGVKNVNLDDAKMPVYVSRLCYKLTNDDRMARILKIGEELVTYDERYIQIAEDICGEPYAFC